MRKCFFRFTLLELLIVISVIMILLSILMPAISNVKKQAASSACINRLRQIMVVENYYSNDYDGYINLAWATNPGSLDIPWFKTAGLYLENSDILECPSLSPSIPLYWSHYGGNRQESAFPGAISHERIVVKASQVNQNTVLFTDTLRNASTFKGQWYFFRYNDTWEDAAVHTRHSGRSSCAFIDCHVSSITSLNLYEYGIHYFYTENGSLVYR